MPELPEVETIRRQLLKKVINKKIIKVEVKLPKLIYVNGRKGDIKNFQNNIVGAVVKKAERKAKILILTFSNGFSLLTHLKMTGQLIYADKDGKAKMGGHPWPSLKIQTPNKWTHVIFYFSDGSKLYFNDLRQFGYMKLVKSDKVLEQPEIKKLGIEPFDKKFTLKKFEELIEARKNSRIKTLLMDQSFISGIGNIYADESLFYAGILPTRLAGILKQGELEKLYQGIKIILKAAIAKGGSSIDRYVTLSGKKGGYEPYLKAYGREGKKCLRCGGIIKRIKLNSRSTHFCSKCQY